MSLSGRRRRHSTRSEAEGLGGFNAVSQLGRHPQGVSRGFQNGFRRNLLTLVERVRISREKVHHLPLTPPPLVCSAYQA